MKFIKKFEVVVEFSEKNGCGNEQYVGTGDILVAIQKQLETYVDNLEVKVCVIDG